MEFLHEIYGGGEVGEEPYGFLFHMVPFITPTTFFF